MSAREGLWGQITGFDARTVDPADPAVDRLFHQRYAAFVALAVGTLVLPRFSVVLPASILVIGLSLNFAAHRLTIRNGRYVAWLQPVDVAACLAFILIAPGALVPCLLVLLTVVSLNATIAGMWSSLAIALLAVTGLIGIDLTVGLEAGSYTGGDLILIVGFTLAALMTATAIGRLASTTDLMRERLNTLVDNLDAVLWQRTADDHRFTFVNQRGVDLLGWPQETWLEPGFWLRTIHPDDRAAAEAAVQAAAEDGTVRTLTYRFRAADGRWVDLQDRVQRAPDRSRGGRGLLLQGLSLDVTERVDIERRVRQYADIVDHIDLALVVFQLDENPGNLPLGHPDGPMLRLLAANPATEALLHRSLGGLIGEPADEVFPAMAGRLRDQVSEMLTTGRPVTIEDLVLRAGTPEQRVVTLRVFPLPDRAIAISLQDVTESVAASEALRREALYDGLTGLPNRRLLDGELHRLVRESPLTGEGVALLVMDLDQFKEVNDALGHHIGDALLHAIGDRLTELLQDCLVARLGGDEFAVVLRGHVDELRAVQIAESIRATLAEPFLLDDVRIQSNASIGIALYPDHATDVSSLVQRADVAMYRAKRAGLGTAVYRAEQDHSSVERITLIGDLPDAAHLGQLRLVYQPCVDLRTGSPVRVEALVRWDHPMLGLIGPDRFIELAELSGAIQPLTRWVLNEGIRSAAEWSRLGIDLGLAVNLSVRNLYDPDLVPFIQDTLRIHGVDPSRLVVELTESELMDDPSLAREIFTNLGALGVATSIDDFGTGYSSLTYLRDLPLQEVKIDRSFVQGMHSKSDEFTIVRSMIDLGHNLGLEVVAEGVEHSEDLDLLTRMGCDLAQGFHISQPLSGRELVAWLLLRQAFAVS